MRTLYIPVQVARFVCHTCGDDTVLNLEELVGSDGNPVCCDEPMEFVEVMTNPHHFAAHQTLVELRARVTDQCLIVNTSTAILYSNRIYQSMDDAYTAIQRELDRSVRGHLAVIRLADYSPNRTAI